MKQIYNYTTAFVVILLALFAVSCEDKLVEKDGNSKDSGALRMLVNFGVSTYLSELPNAEEMGNSVINGKDYDLKNVGLYVYYTEDYEKGILSRPYVRNMECTVKNGELVAILGSGDNPADKQVFIYDHMTVVAFYPYNKEMNKSENFFTLKKDEEKYPITHRDYSEQYYIPYRAQTETDPTRSFYTKLNFVPKHTYKIELVLVSDNTSIFPTPASVKVLPSIDPTTNTDLDKDGKREAWFDHVKVLDDAGGGSNVRQYVGYIFTEEGNRNEIKKGDILMQSDKITLIASHDISVSEQYVYRYGYNMTTGEIFIPTASKIIHDVPSLQAIKGTNTVNYQVCDIDMSVAGNWEPLHIWGGRFDGGGHKLENMTINSTEDEVGLFGLIQGNATVANVNLINPSITVNNSSTDTTYVGAIGGRLNNVLSEKHKLALIGSLPPGLSPVVKEAILKEMMSALFNSQSSIVSSRVENPTIVVNGLAPRVGTIVGQSGNKDPESSYKSRIWDTYSLGGSIEVNGAAPADNAEAFVGGFCGLNQGYITRSYATIKQIKAQAEETVNGNVQLKDIFTGFGTMGTYFTVANGGSIEDSFSTLADANMGVKQFSKAWPSGWVTHTGIWPVYYLSWLSKPTQSFWYKLGGAPSTYPTLQWQRK